MTWFTRTRAALLSASVLFGALAVAPTANAFNLNDYDGDGIPNSVEINGYDADGDGIIDLDLRAMGASPYHKDVFVEMDYMPGELASDADLDRIVESFNSMPLRNPDGSSGIHIHLDAGSASAKYNLGGGNQIEHKALDDNMKVWQEFKNSNFDSKRDDIFHYMIWGDYYGNTSSSGLGWSNGKGFIVTVGKTKWPTANGDVRVGTFIHELGHNLGLGHGGGDSLNYKPNYFSIMNYEYQLYGLPMADGTRRFTYSYYTFQNLDENALDETKGFGPQAYGLKYKNQPAHEAIDFNGNGVIDTEPVSVDLNGDKKLSVLTGSNDMLSLKFQTQLTTSGGVQRIQQQPTLERNELTYEKAQELLAQQR